MTKMDEKSKNKYKSLQDLRNKTGFGEKYLRGLEAIGAGYDILGQYASAERTGNGQE